MQEFKLAAVGRTKREKAAKHLLLEGKIPAVVYGGKENRVIEVETMPFKKTFAEAGESSLIDLSVDGAAPVKVLVQDLQHDPLSGGVIHVDFLEVNMAKKLTTEIPIEFIGESMAVKGLGGTLVKNHATLEVECLPGDLVHEIKIDLAPLQTFEDVIRVKDITPPPGIVFLAEPGEVIALIEAPRSEEELKALEGAVESSVEKVEVLEKKKKEGDEEGAEPAGAAVKKE